LLNNPWELLSVTVAWRSICCTAT